LLFVHLLGGFRVSLDGQAISGLNRPKIQALFAYLLLHPLTTDQREIIADKLRPEAAPEQQRRNLSSTLYRLRQILGGDWLNANSHTISLAAHARLWVDVWEFESLLKRGDPEALQMASEQYRGELLPGIYDDWLLPRRERLREQNLSCLLKLGEIHEVAHRFEKGLSFYRQMLSLDPQREEAGRGVMRCLARLGRFPDALNTYETLQGSLAQTLDVAPGTETRQLANQLRSEWELHQQVSAYSFPSQFVGRLAERTRLLSLLEQARQGQGKLVLLMGEAGIGKTRLLEELAQAADWRGWRVVWGRADEFKITPPYGPLSQAVQQALPPARREQLESGGKGSALALVSVQLLGQPAPQPVPESSSSAQLVHALSVLLDGLQRISPHLILLDDLQWSDPDVWPLLDGLRASLGKMAILLALAVRSDEITLQPAAWSFLHTWDQENEVIIQLTGLGLRELGELAMPWHLNGDKIEKLATASGGNPMFALELLRTEELEIHLQDHPTLSELALQKMIVLSAEAQYALQIAAIIGYHFTYSLWEAIIAAENIDALKIPLLAGELERPGMLHLRADGYSFAHDTLRSAIYTHIPSPQRRQLHQQALRILELGNAQTLDLLYHAQQAQAGEKVACYALLAGEQALASFNYTTAVTFFTLALETPHPEDAIHRFRAISGRAQASDVLANRAAQHNDLLALQPLADQLGDRYRAEVCGDLAHYYWTTGDYQQAIVTGQRGLEIASQLGDRHMWAAILQTLGKASRDQGYYAQARTWFEKALNEYQAVGDTHGTAIVLDLLGIVAQREGQVERAEEHSSRAVSIFRELGDIYNEARALSNLGVVRWMLGDYVLAQESFQTALRINQQIGDRRAELASLSNLASLAGIRGDLEFSLSLLDLALVLARQAGSRDLLANLLLNRGITLHSLGRLRDALDSMDESLALNRTLGRRRGEGYVQYNRGKLLTDLGDYTTAQSALQESIQIRQELGEGKNLLSTQVGILRLYTAQGDWTAARSLLQHTKLSGFDYQKDDPEIRQELNLVAFQVFQAMGEETQALEHLIEAEAAMLENAAALPQMDRPRFLEAIPLNRETRAAVEACSRRSEARLARANAPRGKALTANDFISITWTISAPGDRRFRPDSARRQQVLRRLIAEAETQNAAPTDDDLARALGVSRRTILRDTEVLLGEGVDIKTR